MDTLNAILPFFNILSLIVFVGLASLSGQRMVSRFIRLVRARLEVPVLLKRDIALFGSLLLYFGSAAVVLVLGIKGLGEQWWWVMPRGIVVLSAMAYWTMVEYSLEDDQKKDEIQE